MNKVLVTGSLGFIGSHLVDALLKEGHTVRGIDNLSTGFGSNTNPLAPTFKVDLVKEAELAAGIIKGFAPDVLVANAAWAHEGLSTFCPQKVTENTFNATLNSVIPAIRAGVKRIVFISSMSVYGDQQSPFNETMPRKPVDVYGIAKASCEHMIETLAKVHGFEYVIIRPHNVMGVRQSLSDPYRNVAGIFIRRALAGEDLLVYGDGEQKRAFSQIEDVIPALVEACFSPKVVGEQINIGPREEFSVNYLADLIIKASGKKVKKVHVPDRPLEVKEAFCTNDKAIKLLGYKTTITFEEGVTNMFNWAKELHETRGLAPLRYLEELELPHESAPLLWRTK